MATKKKATKTKAKAVPKVQGFNRTDIVRWPLGGIRLILNSVETEESVEFSISDMDNRISMYSWWGDKEDKKEFVSNLETLADHILELKWHIEDQNSEGNT